MNIYKLPNEEITKKTRIHSHFVGKWDGVILHVQGKRTSKQNMTSEKHHLGTCRGWELSHFGNIEHHLIVAIIDHIPNGWGMFNGDI